MCSVSVLAQTEVYAASPAKIANSKLGDSWEFWGGAELGEGIPHLERGESSAGM